MLCVEVIFQTQSTMIVGEFLTAEASENNIFIDSSIRMFLNVNVNSWNQATYFHLTPSSYKPTMTGTVHQHVSQSVNNAELYNNRGAG